MIIDYSPLASRVSIPGILSHFTAYRPRLAPRVATEARRACVALLVAVAIVLVIAPPLFTWLLEWLSAHWAIVAGVCSTVVVFWAVRASTIVAQRIKLSQFAVANNAKLTLNASDIPPDIGLAHAHGGTIVRENFFLPCSIRLPNTIEFGNYSFSTERYGGWVVTKRWRYFSKQLAYQLPHIVLDSRANNNFGTNLPTGFDGQAIELEGNFSKYFTVYASRMQQVDALYFLSPDIMALLIDIGAQYDIEMHGNTIALYANDHASFTSAAQIKPLLEKIETISTAINKRAARYTDVNKTILRNENIDFESALDEYFLRDTNTLSEKIEMIVMSLVGGGALAFMLATVVYYTFFKQ